MCEQLTSKLSSNQKVSNDLGFGGISATNKTVGSLTGRFSQAVADPSMFSLFQANGDEDSILIEATGKSGQGQNQTPKLDAQTLFAFGVSAHYFWPDSGLFSDRADLVHWTGIDIKAFPASILARLSGSHVWWSTCQIIKSEQNLTSYFNFRRTPSRVPLVTLNRLSVPTLAATARGIALPLSRRW